MENGHGRQGDKGFVFRSRGLFLASQEVILWSGRFLCEDWGGLYTRGYLLSMIDFGTGD